jgi:hypothetical protein
MKDRHWDTLITSIQYGQCVLVLGQEASSPAQGEGGEPICEVPSLAQQLSSRLRKEMESEGLLVRGESLLEVAQQYEDDKNFGRGSLRTLSARFYTTATQEPGVSLDLLARLPFSLVLTTCHDRLFEAALQSQGKEPVSHTFSFKGDRITNSEFLISKLPQVPIVYHLFGSADQPGSLVISESDIIDLFISIISGSSPLPDSLSSYLQQRDRSFLFIGYGVENVHLRVFLKLFFHALNLHLTGSPSVVSDSLGNLSVAERESTILYFRRGSSIELADTSIDSFLTELLQRFEKAGGLRLSDEPATPQFRVFISYAREDGPVARRIFEALVAARLQPWLDAERLEGGEQWNRTIERQLKESDFVLVLTTPALLRKSDSYVNKEIALARERALAVRGTFLIPFRSAELAPQERIEELNPYNDVIYDPAAPEVAMESTISLMRREYQRRTRR